MSGAATTGGMVEACRTWLFMKRCCEDNKLSSVALFARSEVVLHQTVLAFEILNSLLKSRPA